MWTIVDLPAKGYAYLIDNDHNAVARVYNTDRGTAAENAQMIANAMNRIQTLPSTGTTRENL